MTLILLIHSFEYAIGGRQMEEIKTNCMHLIIPKKIYIELIEEERDSLSHRMFLFDTISGRCRGRYISG